MPAQAGIYLWLHWKAEENLDSGLRRNDERKCRLPVDEFRTHWLGAEGDSVSAGVIGLGWLTLTQIILARLQPSGAWPLPAQVRQFVLVVVAVIDRALAENRFPGIHGYCSSSRVSTLLLCQGVGRQHLSVRR